MGREMKGTLCGVRELLARRDEHGAERSGFRSIEQLGRLRQPLRTGPSRGPLSRRRRLKY